MKKILFTILFALSFNCFSWDQTPARPLSECSNEAPFGFPSGKSGADLCRLAYATTVDLEAKLPIWNVYTLTPQEAIGCFPRTNAFVEDRSLPDGKRAHPDDYAGTGYDKGHVAPDGDMSFDQQIEYESFLMSNMMPQTGSLNRGVWKKLETYIRAWSVQHNTNITIYAGPIYRADAKTIGKNKVIVPDAFYKIVIDNNTKDVLAFVFPHEGFKDKELDDLLSTVATVEEKTGLKFPLPSGANLNKKITDFPVDFGDLTKAKREKCK